MLYALKLFSCGILQKLLQITFCSLFAIPCILSKTVRIIAQVLKMFRFDILWCKQYQFSLHIHLLYLLQSNNAKRSLQRVLLLFLALFRVIESSSTIELILQVYVTNTTSSLIKFCSHTMQKCLPVLNMNVWLSKTRTEPAPNNSPVNVGMVKWGTNKVAPFCQHLQSLLSQR